ncbi:neutrophil gelatinase-associated lipocalin-like [Heterocephalus glaber]|uniref:Neutrophil gelatinase-associated lipocalin-like n=1 Tax=Heterocephalus glaber TaxID=10181 RepID=A0AAX6T528_HETGA|nr:neutrophil gelatinase-associated lipocalin-like [Heterocephalus glaber]
MADIDYDQLAAVCFTQAFRDSVYLYLTLYGRTKELSPDLKEHFINFAKSFGLTDDNIVFHVPIGLLYLGFILLEALQTLAQDFSPTLLPSPPLSKIPVQPDFRDDKFQGKWYTIATADNRILNRSEKEINMSSIIYELEYDHSYIANSTLLRGQVCEHFIRTFVPSVQCGQFTMGNMKRHHGVQSYTMRVAATNYNEFAVVCIKQIIRNRVYFRMDLYGRTKELSSEVQECFFKFSKSLGLSEDHIIFFEPIEECIDG